MDETYMDMALVQARSAMKQGEVPVGAVIVRDGEVIARAHNVRNVDPTAHAEILALRAACLQLDCAVLPDCTLYVTLEPCAMCAGAIIAARMGRVVFGAFDEEAGCCGSVYALTSDAALRASVPVTGGVLRAPCASILREYFTMRRSK